MAGPRILDLNTLIKAGIDPKTGLPIKASGRDKAGLKDNVNKLLRIKDEQDAVNRYTWYNLPDGLNGQMVERMLYYKGQLAFFYMEANETFYLLPYALDGTIDVYGRFTGITPVPFGGGSTKDENGNVKPWIQGLKFKPKYDILTENDLDEKTFTSSCVLLFDYTPQYSEQNILPRQILQDPIINVMSSCIPWMRTNLLNSVGISGMKVQDEDDQANVKFANASLEYSADVGEAWIPIVGKSEFQDLQQKAPAQSNDYMLAMNSLNNFRLECLGVPNGGIWQRQGTTIEDEFNVNASSSDLIMLDGLQIRQRFCNIVNSIWNLGIWCEQTPKVAGMGLPTEQEADNGISQSGINNDNNSTNSDSTNTDI